MEDGHNLYLSINGELAGWVDLKDEIRPEAKQVVSYLKSKGIKTWLLSGDRKFKSILVAKELGIDLQAVLDKSVTPTAEQLQQLATNKISAVHPTFAGVTIHNIFEFFMGFVGLCGLASVILFMLTPKLKKMMHGVV